ncbi:hypothetical protein BKA70DRAFT_1427718 [Coprinopsis sp. MPI-PUGE-AT-0042]|nr:hypothetical protein BKA70DRAFT_1427718 [Coprinopsis sp. MPI-PUGE-AT-0042]
MFQAESLTVNVHGGTFNSGNNINVGNQDGHVIKQAIQAILDAIPNYRDIHAANLGKATEGTGPRFPVWQQYCQWLIPQAGLKSMWGTGMPGTGKTIFASIVINEVEHYAERSDLPICVAYIYFRYSDHTKATVRDFLMILVKQSIERHPNCLQIFSQLYQKHIREKTQPSDAELLHLLRRFSEVISATFYFLDAVDEAPPGVIFELLKKLSSLKVKIFITSRPLNTLQAQFPESHFFDIIAQDCDLDLHIAERISRSPELQIILKANPALQETIALAIKRKCGGMFLHASLKLDALLDCASVHDVIQTLEEFPPRIEDVYHRTWDRIVDQTPRKSLLAKQLLVWVLYTHRFDESRLVDKDTLMATCRGLVDVEEKTNIVHFVHYTAKEVMKDLILESFPYPHALPTAVSIALLLGCGFQACTFESLRDLEDSLKRNPLLAYAYEAWPIHARQSLDDVSTALRLTEFIQACQSFPVRLYFGVEHAQWCIHSFFGISSSVTGEESTGNRMDVIGSLHMSAFFNLPVDLI